MTQACKVAFWRQENIWNQRMESISLIFKILGCTFTVVLLQLHQFLKKSNQYYLLLCLLFYNLYYSKFSQIRCILFLFIVLEIINCELVKLVLLPTRYAYLHQFYEEPLSFVPIAPRYFVRRWIVMLILTLQLKILLLVTL